MEYLSSLSNLILQIPATSGALIDVGLLTPQGISGMLNSTSQHINAPGGLPAFITGFITPLYHLPYGVDLGATLDLVWAGMY